MVTTVRDLPRDQIPKIMRKAIGHDAWLLTERELVAEWDEFKNSHADKVMTEDEFMHGLKDQVKRRLSGK